MPKRRVTRKRGGYRRFKKRYMSYSRMAYTAYKGVRMLKGLVNVEKKLFTNSGFSGNPSNTGYITVLNTINAGDDVAERNGNSILAKYMTGKIYITQNSSATNTVVRCIIFQDLANQSSTPSVASVLEAVNPASPMNVDNVDRYWILYDRMITLSTGGKTMVPLNIFRRLNFHCKYDGTGGTDYEINAICMLLISNEPTNTPTVTGYWRLAYYDN